MGMLVRFIKISFLTLLVVCIHQNMGVAQEPANKNPVADISDFLAVKKDMWWRYKCVRPDGGVGKITRRIAKITHMDGDIVVSYANFSKSADLPQSCIDRFASNAQREGRTLTKRQAVVECIASLALALPKELRISPDGVYQATMNILPYPFSDRTFLFDEDTTVIQRLTRVSGDEIPIGASDNLPESVITELSSGDSVVFRHSFIAARGLGITLAVHAIFMGNGTTTYSCRLIAVGTNSAKEAKGGK